jgi:hypothetical protein
MTHPQQPPVMHGYPAQPPNNDWGQPPPAKKRGPLPWLIGALVVSVLGMAGLIAWLALSGDDEPAAAPAAAPPAATAMTLAAVDKACDPANQLGMRLDDGERTLIIEGVAGTESLTDATWGDIRCILGNLNAPEAAIAQAVSMESGVRRSASWPGFSATWIYEPAAGLDLIVTATS